MFRPSIYRDNNQMWFQHKIHVNSRMIRPITTSYIQSCKSEENFADITCEIPRKERRKKLSRVFLATNWLKLFSDSITFAFRWLKHMWTSFSDGEFHCQLHTCNVMHLDGGQQTSHSSQAKLLIGFISSTLSTVATSSLALFVKLKMHIFLHSSRMSLWYPAREWNSNTFFNYEKK